MQKKAVSRERTFHWVIYTNKTDYKNKTEHIFAQQSPLHKQLFTNHSDLLDC